MSKVMCDVCGTAYPETAAQCPICGSAKNSPNQTAAGSAPAQSGEGGGYTSVRGGRFSKKNVKKRNRGASNTTTAQRRSSAASTSRSTGSRRNQSQEQSNTGLIIVVILLIAAIIAVLIYIGISWTNRNQKPDNTEDTKNPGTSDATDPSGSSDPVVIPCQNIALSNSIIELGAEGDTWKITVECEPVDTTDTVTFESSDPTVATVADDGTVTAVGGGGAVITVHCGYITKTCVVNCTFGEITGDDPPAEFIFEWNTPFVDSATGNGDTTLSKQGATWKAYKSTMNVAAEDVTWISDDPTIATIENGVVTAVAPGTVKVHAQYNGITYTCVVRCSFTVTEEGSCTISHTDVTIAVGESFNLRLKDTDGNVLDVVWQANDVNVTIDGNKITGASSGRVIVSTEYEGVTYSCVIYVK